MGLFDSLGESVYEFSPGDAQEIYSGSPRAILRDTFGGPSRDSFRMYSKKPSTDSLYGFLHSEFLPVITPWIPSGLFHSLHLQEFNQRFPQEFFRGFLQ